MIKIMYTTILPRGGHHNDRVDNLMSLDNIPVEQLLMWLVHQAFVVWSWLDIHISVVQSRTWIFIISPHNGLLKGLKYWCSYGLLWNANNLATETRNGSPNPFWATLLHSSTGCRCRCARNHINYDWHTICMGKCIISIQNNLAVVGYWTEILWLAVDASAVSRGGERLVDFAFEASSTIKELKWYTARENSQGRICDWELCFVSGGDPGGGGRGYLSLDLNRNHVLNLEQPVGWTECRYMVQMFPHSFTCMTCCDLLGLVLD